MLGAFTPDMTSDEEDRAAWIHARSGGMHEFVERRVMGIGTKLGLALALWNAIAGGTFHTYHARWVLLEGAYYFIGSVALCGIGAALEWRHLERRFTRAKVAR